MALFYSSVVSTISKGQKSPKGIISNKFYECSSVTKLFIVLLLAYYYYCSFIVKDAFNNLLMEASTRIKCHL